MDPAVARILNPTQPAGSGINWIFVAGLGLVVLAFVIVVLQPRAYLPGEDPVFTPDALKPCLLYTSPSPRDGLLSRMPSSA